MEHFLKAGGAVTNPTAGDVHVNRPLTNFSIKYLQDQSMFVATRAFPNLPVTNQSDLYWEFEKDDFFRNEAEKRADGAESVGSGFNVSTNPYFCDVWGFHKLVTDRQRANQDPGIQLDQSATEFVTMKGLIARELDMTATFMVASAWNTTSAPNWSGTTDDPIVQVRAQSRVIQQNTGFRPNKMLMARQAWDTLQDNDSILSRITGGATTAIPAMVMRELVAQLFEIDMIYVIDSIYNPSLEGAATQNYEFANADDALLYYAPDTVGLNQPTAGVGFSWTGLLGNSANGMRIRRFRNEDKQADKIELDMSFDHRVTGNELGHLFTSVSS